MARTIEQIKEKIAQESLKPGDKLSTLNQLAVDFGVSRTVIREAVISLSSDGILESRHGVGVFVRDRNASSPHALNASILAPLATFNASLMDLLELRVAFEVHAAGLAASRRSWGQESKIWEAARNLEASLDSEEDLDKWDIAFHQAIAEATNNAAFIEFFNLMSAGMMPQPAFSWTLQPTLITPDYIQQTVQEHRAICEAISAGNPEQAQAAMRAHLLRSHRRYQGFHNSSNMPDSNLLTGLDAD